MEETKEKTEEKQQDYIPESIKLATQAAQELKAAKEEADKTLKELRELKANEILGGRAEAGKPAAKQEDPREYAERVLKGKL